MNRRLAWIIWILLIAATCIILAVNVIVSAAYSPSFCAICHQTQAGALQKSEHSEIQCNTCHQRNSVFDVLAWRARIVGMVWRQVTFSYKSPVISQIPRDSCKQCHESVLTGIVVNRAIKMSHKEVDDYFKCTECHSTVAHPGAVTNPRPAAMDRCSGCHDEQRTSASCDTCHVEEIYEREQAETNWRVTHGPQWRKLHGMGNLNTCATCHGSIFCLRCHNAALPHPDFWIRHHARKAKDDAKGCYKCHHKSYCLSCHGVDMPHNEQFFKTHGDTAGVKGKKTCYRCHLEQGCERCHEKHIHPGLRRGRLQELKRGAGFDK